VEQNCWHCARNTIANSANSWRKTMKAITLHQPWATLVAIRAKQIETRSWNTQYRGKLAIHAGKNTKYVNMKSRDYLCDEEPFYSILMTEMAWKNNPLPLGCIVAVCELVDTKQIDEVISFPACKSYTNVDRKCKYILTDQERAFGDYSVGRFMWLLDNIQILPEPIPAKGSMGFWEWEGL
jgi:activating signal cointegrator 1